MKLNESFYPDKNTSLRNRLQSNQCNNNRSNQKNIYKDNVFLSGSELRSSSDNRDTSKSSEKSNIPEGVELKECKIINGKLVHIDKNSKINHYKDMGKMPFSSKNIVNIDIMEGIFFFGNKIDFNPEHTRMAQMHRQGMVKANINNIYRQMYAESSQVANVHTYGANKYFEKYGNIIRSIENRGRAFMNDMHDSTIKGLQATDKFIGRAGQVLYETWKQSDNLDYLAYGIIWGGPLAAAAYPPLAYPVASMYGPALKYIQFKERYSVPSN